MAWDAVGHPDVVVPGVAVARRYGLGAAWTGPKPGGIGFDRAAICGKDSACAAVTNDEAVEFFSVGPPYLLAKEDFVKVANYWWEFMPAVYEQDKGDIQADMVNSCKRTMLVIST